MFTVMPQTDANGYTIWNGRRKKMVKRVNTDKFPVVFDSRREAQDVCDKLNTKYA